MKEIKEQEISSRLHGGLSIVIPKTNGEIYVPISIGKYIITFTCFLHLSKKVVLLKRSKVRLPLEKPLSKKYSC